MEERFAEQLLLARKNIQALKNDADAGKLKVCVTCAGEQKATKVAMLLDRA